MVLGKKKKRRYIKEGVKNRELTNLNYRISLTIVDTPGFGDNIDNEAWLVYIHLLLIISIDNIFT